MPTERLLAKKLSSIMGEVGYVQKDGSNSYHKYKYASAEAVLKKVNAALSKNNIALESNADILYTSDDLTNVIAKVTLILVDGDTGETMSIAGCGQGSDKTDKATMKAITAATKYTLSTGFLISWGDDPEEDIYSDLVASLESEVTDFDTLRKWKDTNRKFFSKLTKTQQASIMNTIKNLDKEYGVINGK